MAWDPLDDNEFTGDLPMDAFGGAWAEISKLWQERVGRLPTVSRAADAMRAALVASRAMAGVEPARIDAALERFITTPRAPKVPRRKHPVEGDLLRIPYGGAGSRAVYGRMLYVQSPLRAPNEREYLPCCAVLDRDVLADDDIASVPDAPWLLGPLRVGWEVTNERIWEVIANVPLRAGEQELPYFLVGRNGRWVTVDYFDKEVAETPETKSRIRQSTGFDTSSSIGASEIVQAVRALRGARRWEVRFNRLLARGRQAPRGGR